MDFTFFNNFGSEAKLAIRAAEAAGIVIREIYNRSFDVKEKANDDGPVTEADLASNAAIVSILAASGLPILSEETVDTFERLQAEKIWIVDPIDGTQDFINRTGQCSVMIALVKNGEPIVGVVYAPITNIYYAGEKGKGAFCYKDGVVSRLEVTKTAEVTSATVLMSKNHLSTIEEGFLEKLSPKKVMQRGSSGLKIAEVAAGFGDFYFTCTSKISEWDTAAGYTIITEAGGSITDTLGDPLQYNIRAVRHPNEPLRKIKVKRSHSIL
jgi:3'(2'), 5'-bisphosphate nucleotidase